MRDLTPPEKRRAGRGGGRRRSGWVLGCTLACGTVHAAEPMPALALSCEACHGGGAIAALHTGDPAAMIEALQAYREGRRPGTVMPRLARGLDDEDIAALARWFSAPGPPR